MNKFKQNKVERKYLNNFFVCFHKSIICGHIFAEEQIFDLPHSLFSCLLQIFWIDYIYLPNNFPASTNVYDNGLIVLLRCTVNGPPRP